MRGSANSRVRKCESIGENKRNARRKAAGSGKATNGHAKFNLHPPIVKKSRHLTSQSTTEAFGNPQRQGPNTPVLGSWASSYPANPARASQAHGALAAKLDTASASGEHTANLSTSRSTSRTPLQKVSEIDQGQRGRIKPARGKCNAPKQLTSHLHAPRLAFPSDIRYSQFV